jgi:hypothetical protein
VVWGSAQRISKARWAGALPVHGAGTVHTCRRHALGVSDDHDERTPPLAKPLQALCYELSTDASALVRRPDCHRPECRPYLRPHRQRTEQNVAHDGAIRDGNESQRDDPSVANGVDDATFPLLIEGLPIQLPNGIDIRRLFFPDLNHVFLALSAERSAAAAARSAVRCMLLLAGAPRCVATARTSSRSSSRTIGGLPRSRARCSAGSRLWSPRATSPHGRPGRARQMMKSG